MAGALQFGGVKTLLAASEGGHLIELSLLAERLSLPGERAWVTFDTPQSRSLLGGEMCISRHSPALAICSARLAPPGGPGASCAATALTQW